LVLQAGIKEKRSTNGAERQAESGNVLFLILIAVALFAALSYAVTSSTRSGGSSSSEERSLISSAQLTQYPAGIRTSLVRMVIDGIDAEEFYFNPPSEFDCPSADDAICDEDDDERDEQRSVFHPAGGGAAYQRSQPEVMANGKQGRWVFTSAWEIEDIGTGDGPGGERRGNDIIAMLPGVAAGVCRRINEQLGIDVDEGTDNDGDGIPAGTANGVEPDLDDHTMNKENPGIMEEEDVIGEGAFDGQAYGCFDLSDSNPPGDGPYVYYHVLIER
jgi:hypothetical protein